jgi:hypothetical protein
VLTALRRRIASLGRERGDQRMPAKRKAAKKTAKKKAAKKK